MATQKKSQQLGRQGANNRSSSDSYYIPPADALVDKTNEHGQVIFLICLIVIMLILPLFLYLMAAMYFDMLTVQQENKRQEAIIRRLIVELENKK
jgi:hypothetical protein